MTRQPTDKQIQTGYAVAKERYGMYGVDTDKVIKALGAISISLHCWQGDDVAGFMNDGGNLGGVLPTGNYLGRARTADELRADLEKVLSLLPGRHRINLHSMYAETGGKHVERDELKPEHFVNWAEWAKRKGLGMDFNPSFFSHPKASSGFTLASYDEGIRKYWIGHSIACRKIGEYFGKTLGTPCVTNIWIPDGYKDTPVDRSTPRKLLKDSLDQIFAEKINPKYNLDAVEPKLFGIGSESYVVGSSEFYLGYAAKNGVLLCLDSGHYHPTETISDKLSAVLATVPEVLLHVSRGVRWDSDHVVLLNDDLQAIAQELVRGNFLDRVHIGLDYFDASINRISAWVTGARNMQKALLLSLLEPLDEMKQLETSGDFTGRMALMEEIKSLPYGPVWDTFCMQQEVPVSYIDSIRQHEKEVLVKRS